MAADHGARNTDEVHDFLTSDEERAGCVRSLGIFSSRPYPLVRSHGRRSLDRLGGGARGVSRRAFGSGWQAMRKKELATAERALAKAQAKLAEFNAKFRPRCGRRLRHLPNGEPGSRLRPDPRASAQRYARCRLAAARAHRQRVKARTHPIRREVVLRPAWRAWRSLLSKKRKSTVLSRQCSHAFTFATGASARRRRTISKSIAWMLSRVGSLTPGSLVSGAPSARDKMPCQPAGARTRFSRKACRSRGRRSSPLARSVRGVPPHVAGWCYGPMSA